MQIYSFDVTCNGTTVPYDIKAKWYQQAVDQVVLKLPTHWVYVVTHNWEREDKVRKLDEERKIIRDRNRKRIAEGVMLLCKLIVWIYLIYWIIDNSKTPIGQISLGNIILVSYLLYWIYSDNKD